jgi:hypothetical protein
LITLGGGIRRTDHFHARMHLTMEAIIENKILVLYKHTSKMIADGLSETFTFQAFKDFHNIVLETALAKD